MTRLLIVATAASIVVGLVVTLGGNSESAPPTAAALVAIAVWLLALMLAGAPYWYRRPVERAVWATDGAVAVYVTLIVALGWLLFFWGDTGLIGIYPFDEPAWPLSLIPVVLLGVVWRGRALFPAVLALVFCGVVDELVNGETCLPASEWGCGGPVDAAYFSILIVTPMILLGAAVSHVVGLGVAAIRR